MHRYNLDYIINWPENFTFFIINTVPDNYASAKMAFLYPIRMYIHIFLYTCISIDRPSPEGDITNFVFSVSRLTDEIFTLKIDIPWRK